MSSMKTKIAILLCSFLTACKYEPPICPDGKVRISVVSKDPVKYVQACR